MAAGLGVLRLPPAVFWATTPRELAAALRALAGSAPHVSPPSRGDLDRLMRLFPDA